MPVQKNKNDKLQVKNSTFVLAITSRLDAQIHKTAQQLNKNPALNYAYTLTDSLNSSYCMYKYFFDVSIQGGADELHESLLTTEGLIAMGLGTSFILGFSILAHYYSRQSKDNLNRFKKQIASAWPLSRDIIKGLKNGYKGCRSTIIACATLCGTNRQYLIAPLGVALGLIAVGLRIRLAFTAKKHQAMLKQNKALLQEILQQAYLSHEQRLNFLDKIRYQSFAAQVESYCLHALEGIIDGLYLYMGVLSLTASTYPILLTMALFCSIYVLCCIVTRVHKAYEEKLSLQITQTQCELALLSKALEANYTCLLNHVNNTHQFTRYYKQIGHHRRQALHQLLEQFAFKVALFEKQTSKPYWSAALIGLKNGLSAYGVLASVVFTCSSVLMLAGVAFPQLLLLTGIVLGTVMLLGCIIQSLMDNYTKKHHLGHEIFYQQCLTHYLSIEKIINKKEVHQIVERTTAVDAAKEPATPKWFEVFRALFSGFSKGQKVADFLLNPLQKKGADGHYHDSLFMLIIASINALFFGTVLGLRALGKELGEPPKPPPKVEWKEDACKTQNPSNAWNTQSPKITAPIQPAPVILPVNPHNSRHTYRFFNSNFRPKTKECSANQLLNEKGFRFMPS